VVERGEVVEVAEMDIEAPQLRTFKRLNELCALFGTTGEMKIAEAGKRDWSSI
jgi:hypothetical protein